MDYLLIKQFHMSLALVSITGFVIRWIWRMSKSHFSNKLAVRVLPHLIDSLFLASAITMIYLQGQVPIGNAWLIAKIAGLVMYIMLGILAMRSAPDAKLSLPAFLLAVLVFCWVFSVAHMKTPSGFL
jgi:uncharacterized membrane protein SirB2